MEPDLATPLSFWAGPRRELKGVVRGRRKPGQRGSHIGSTSTVGGAGLRWGQLEWEVSRPCITSPELGRPQ